jgi:tRNA threonylcarbamoyladenosine biosynthesis protein TsaB
MPILALETATEACSAALYLADGRIISRFEHAPRLQTQLLLPMVDDLLREAGITLQNLDAVAYSRGPGAFTGVRIAAAAAQGFAFGLNLPVLALSSLQVLAQHVHRAYRCKTACWPCSTPAWTRSTPEPTNCKTA